MKDQAQLFIDQRGSNLRVLVAEDGQVFADSILPGPLEGDQTLKNLIATLATKSGRNPLHAHLLIATDRVELSTYQLQEMPLNDVKKIIERGIASTTGENNPVFHLTHLAPQQDKDVYLAEQIPRATIIDMLQRFKDAGIKLASISTGLQATLAAFEPHRADIMQAQVLLDISDEAITATFLSTNEVLHLETHEIQDPNLEREEDEDVDSSRELKRRLFAILNVIHTLYSQYMRANPFFPVEKVWICGPGSDIVGLEESLVDAMDVDVARLDLLAGQIPGSHSFTPLAGLINADQQGSAINFIPVEISSPVRISSKAKALAAGAVLVLAITIIGLYSQFNIWKVQKQLKLEQTAVQQLQAQAAANNGRVNSLTLLKQLKETAPPLYELFGEIADNLPRTVQIDGLNFRHEEQVASLELLAVIKHETARVNEQIFSDLMSTLSSSKYLICNQEPDISILNAEGQKLVKIKVKCQITSTDEESK